MTGAGKFRKREFAIAALLEKATIADAASAIGVSEKTLRRWLQDPDFAAEHRAAQRQAVDLAIAGLKQATGEAVATLRRNLTSGMPSVEVRAATEILSQTARWQELDELGERVKALEEAAQGRGAP